MKTSITYIFLDVGGVVISDYSGTNRWNEMLTDLGVTDDTRSKFMDIWKSHRASIGLNYDIEDMVDELRKDVGLQLPEDFNFNDEFVSRFSPNPYIDIPLKTIARAKMPTGLLTNMYIGMFNKIKRAGLLPNYPFDPIIDSSIVKLTKPNPSIYVYAQETIHTEPEHIFFVDNVVENTTAASKLGWQTFLFDSSDMEKSSLELDTVIHQMTG